MKYKSKNAMLVLLMSLNALSSSASSNPQGLHASQTLDVFAAEYGSPSDPRCEKGTDPCLIFLSDQPVFTLHDFSYTATQGQQPGIEIKIGDRGVAALNRVLDQYKDKRIAIIYDGQIIHAPTIKERLVGDGIFLTFSDENRLEEVKKILEQPSID